ncbi:hypothetical protein HK102_004369, partial [Quaeritorhiza haematococci]
MAPPLSSSPSSPTPETPSAHVAHAPSAPPSPDSFPLQTLQNIFIQTLRRFKAEADILQMRAPSLSYLAVNPSSSEIAQFNRILSAAASTVTGSSSSTATTTTGAQEQQQQQQQEEQPHELVVAAVSASHGVGKSSLLNRLIFLDGGRRTGSSSTNNDDEDVSPIFVGKTSHNYAFVHARRSWKYSPTPSKLLPISATTTTDNNNKVAGTNSPGLVLVSHTMDNLQDLIYVDTVTSKTTTTDPGTPLLSGLNINNTNIEKVAVAGPFASSSSSATANETSNDNDNDPLLSLRDLTHDIPIDVLLYVVTPSALLSASATNVEWERTRAGLRELRKLASAPVIVVNQNGASGGETWSEEQIDKALDEILKEDSSKPPIPRFYINNLTSDPITTTPTLTPLHTYLTRLTSTPHKSALKSLTTLNSLSTLSTSLRSIASSYVSDLDSVSSLIENVEEVFKPGTTEKPSLFARCHAAGV